MNFSLLFDDPVEYGSRAIRYRERFVALERLANRKGIDVASMDLAVAERLWEDTRGQSEHTPAE